MNHSCAPRGRSGKGCAQPATIEHTLGRQLGDARHAPLSRRKSMTRSCLRSANTSQQSWGTAAGNRDQRPIALGVLPDARRAHVLGLNLGASRDGEVMMAELAAEAERGVVARALPEARAFRPSHARTAAQAHRSPWCGRRTSRTYRRACDVHRALSKRDRSGWADVHHARTEQPSPRRGLALPSCDAGARPPQRHGRCRALREGGKSPCLFSIRPAGTRPLSASFSQS